RLTQRLSKRIRLYHPERDSECKRHVQSKRKGIACLHGSDLSVIEEQVYGINQSVRENRVNSIAGSVTKCRVRVIVVEPTCGQTGVQAYIQYAAISRQAGHSHRLSGTLALAVNIVGANRIADVQEVFAGSDTTTPGKSDGLAC